MAYNKVPEGAEYDVFSENTRNVNPSLLYDDIPSANPPKAQEERKNDSAQPYDLFSENAGTVEKPKETMKREYLDAFFEGGIDLFKEDIRLTRSEYIAQYNRINENYKEEKTKCQVNIFWVAAVFAFGIAVLIMIERLQLSVGYTEGSEYLSMIFNGIRTGVFVANPIISGFLLVSTIKSIKNAKTAREKALKRLEQRKEELMILGLYDTAN